MGLQASVSIYVLVHFVELTINRNGFVFTSRAAARSSRGFRCCPCWEDVFLGNFRCWPCWEDDFLFLCLQIDIFCWEDDFRTSFY